MGHPDTINQLCLCLGSVSPPVSAPCHLAKLQHTLSTYIMHCQPVSYLVLYLCHTLYSTCVIPCQISAGDDVKAKDAITRRYRMLILVLEVLAAICLVSKGHGRVLGAFDNYKMVRHGDALWIAVQCLGNWQRSLTYLLTLHVVTLKADVCSCTKMSSASCPLCACCAQSVTTWPSWWRAWLASTFWFTVNRTWASRHVESLSLKQTV